MNMVFYYAASMNGRNDYQKELQEYGNLDDEI